MALTMICRSFLGGLPIEGFGIYQRFEYIPLGNTQVGGVRSGIHISQFAGFARFFKFLLTFQTASQYEILKISDYF